MKVQPRQQILDVWRGVIAESFHGNKWRWGGRDGRNSISDAEQLLCLMGPATTFDTFGIDDPNRTVDDVLSALSPLGASYDIPQVLVRALTDYMETYTDESGTPVFSCEGYFSLDKFMPAGELNEQQRQLHVVDSFAISVTLSLATIGFLREFRQSVRKEKLSKEITDLEELAGKRLSAAMVGLLRSFTIFVFPADSGDGVALCRMVNQTNLPAAHVVEKLRSELREINARLHTVTIGSGSGLNEELDRPNHLFECGWSWGVVKGAPEITTTEDVGKQVVGVAQNAAYMYFTVVALDGISALFSERTRLLGLLNEEQLRLAQALQWRYDVTQSYWSTIASFGDGRWPIEDVPWQRTNEKVSDYFSLLISSIVVQDLIRKRASDNDLDRVGRVLDELAQRSRITRRHYVDDEGYKLHAPGVQIELAGSDVGGGPTLMWTMSDFAPLLMQRTVRLAGLLRDTNRRARMLTLADRTWEHLASRRLDLSRGDLWDQPQGVFPYQERFEAPSWYFTKRVLDCLITAASVVNSPPLRSERVAFLAADLLSEADHLYDQELLRGPVASGPAMRKSLQALRAQLDRARSISGGHPGSAAALALQILLELDRLASARDDRDGED